MLQNVKLSNQAKSLYERSKNTFVPFAKTLVLHNTDLCTSACVKIPIIHTILIGYFSTMYVFS